MTHTPSTCTVRFATRGACGKPAVWSDGTFAECAEHAADLIALARREATPFGRALGDEVEIHRHGRTYIGTVVRIGARGAVFAEVTYGNGAKRVVRV